MKNQLLCFAVLIALSAAERLHADLAPAEIAIIANKNVKESQQLAAYYAQKRGIPRAQVCVLDLPNTEELSRADWEQKVRPTIVGWIDSNNLRDKIRCMATVWGVPLKITKAAPDANTQKRVQLLRMERQRRMERLLDFVSQFDQIANDGSPPQSTLTTESTLQDVTSLLGQRLKAAEGRIQGLTEQTAKGEAIKTLTQLSVATAGLQVVTQNLQRTVQAGSANERVVTEFQFGRGRLAGLGEGQALLDGLPATVERDTNLIALIERSTGIAGTIQWIDQQLAMVESNETHSSFDSELSLVLEEDYQLLRWLPNYLHYNYDGSPLREIQKVTMVSRIDAPTIKLAKELIDKALAVEQTGLQGNVYLDSRGIAKLDGQAPGRGTPAEYDRSLLLAEKLLKENTSLNVVSNNVPELFKAGECPDAALYCGWYSLAKYVDAFAWKPGSVGYHMASSEAATLKKPDSQVWCKQMLDRGVTATCGPVYEPYLLAFPKPDEFFALLCSGKYTYVECMYRTKATTSWTMTTIGDPLYNPFKAKPVLATPPAQYARLFGEK